MKERCVHGLTLLHGPQDHLAGMVDVARAKTRSAESLEAVEVGLPEGASISDYRRRMMTAHTRYLDPHYRMQHHVQKSNVSSFAGDHPRRTVDRRYRPSHLQYRT